MIYYGIPSFRRSFCTKTIDYLESLGVPKERIILSLQDDQDIKEYTEAGFGDRCVIISCHGDRVSVNRNNILRYAESKGLKFLLMIDDDVSRIEIMDENRRYKTITSETQIEELFYFSLRNNAPLFGLYPLRNSMFMTPNKVRKRCIVVGVVLGFSDMGLRFDESLRMKEDYDICLNIINRRKNCIRFDYIAPVTKYRQKGGCSEDYKANRSEESTNILIERYPFLIKRNPKRKGEIIMQNIE